jgi:hypothetical protein
VRVDVGKTVAEDAAGMARRGELRSIAEHDGTNLAELLLLIGQATVREMAWDVDLIDYVVAPDDPLGHLPRYQAWLSGDEMLQLAYRLFQVIDGSIAGYAPSRRKKSPQLRIEFIDSSLLELRVVPSEALRGLIDWIKERQATPKHCRRPRV